MAGSGVIRDFINNSYLKRGFLRPSDFVVEFTNYSTTNISNQFGFVDNFLNKLSVNIKSVELPAFTLETEAAPYRHKITKRTLSDLTMSFYDSIDHEIRKNMHKWINGIVQDDSDVGQIERRYLDDCMINIKIKQLLPGNKLTTSDMWESFKGVFPVSVSSVSFDTATENEIGLTTVQWKYWHHSIGEESDNPGWVPASERRFQ